MLKVYNNLKNDLINNNTKIVITSFNLLRNIIYLYFDLVFIVKKYCYLYQQ